MLKKYCFPILCTTVGGILFFVNFYYLPFRIRWIVPATYVAFSMTVVALLAIWETDKENKY